MNAYQIRENFWIDHTEFNVGNSEAVNKAFNSYLQDLTNNGFITDQFAASIEL